MRARQSLPRSLHVLARAQAGVLTARQLGDGGLSATVIRRMAVDWLHPARGIYLTAAPTWESAAWAGLLRGGPGAVVSGVGAAYLHTLTRDSPSRIVIAAAHQRQPFTVGGWAVEFRRLTRAALGTPPRTRVEATIIDMARDCTDDALVSVLARAFADNRTTPGRVLGELEGRRRVRHSATIRAMCERGAEGIESALEWRFHTSVLIPHGLPIPERQVSTHQGRVDALYRECGLVVELDGMRDHTDWSKDMMRDNEHLIVDDHRTLRYGWGSVHGQRCAVADQLARAKQKLGWRGRMRPCPACPPEAASLAA